MTMARNGIIVVFFVMIVCGFCNCTVYKIGDSAGWAVAGNTNYNKWASPKSFQIGDTFVFEYNPSFHNLLQVSRPDFHSCNTKSPIATYATGNDSVVINRPGHYYFICGFVGHCQAGQKVDIRVPNSGRSHGSPISAPFGPHNETFAPDVSFLGPMAPGPSHSSGQFLMRDGNLLFLNFVLLIFVRIFN